MAKIDKQAVRDAYEEVRNDSSETNWAIMKYDESSIVLDSTGADFSEFVSKFSDDERIFAFLRVIAGDELSKRVKFVLIVWLGSNVSGIKRARMGPDKTAVKEVIRNYAVELMINDMSDLNEDYIRAEVKKAGGANYGTGCRD